MRSSCRDSSLTCKRPIKSSSESTSTIRCILRGPTTYHRSFRPLELASIAQSFQRRRRMISNRMWEPPARAQLVRTCPRKAACESWIARTLHRSPVLRKANTILLTVDTEDIDSNVLTRGVHAVGCNLCGLSVLLSCLLICMIFYPLISIRRETIVSSQ